MVTVLRGVFAPKAPVAPRGLPSQSPTRPSLLAALRGRLGELERLELIHETREQQRKALIVDLAKAKTPAEEQHTQAVLVQYDDVVDELVWYENEIGKVKDQIEAEEAAEIARFNAGERATRDRAEAGGHRAGPQTAATTVETTPADRRIDALEKALIAANQNLSLARDRVRELEGKKKPAKHAPGKKKAAKKATKKKTPAKASAKKKTAKRPAKKPAAAAKKTPPKKPAAAAKKTPPKKPAAAAKKTPAKVDGRTKAGRAAKTAKAKAAKKD